MKLLRYGGVGAEKPGILGGPGIIQDLSGHVADIDGNFLTNRALDEVSDLDLNCLPMVERSVRIGACVANVGKFICIGLINPIIQRNRVWRSRKNLSSL